MGEPKLQINEKLSNEDLSLLSELTYLNHLPKDLYSKVIGLFSLEKFPKGTAILTQNQKNKVLYILKSGKLDLFVDNEKITSIDIPGEPVGDISAILDRAVTATVIASTEVELIYLNLENLKDTQGEYANFIHNFKEAYIDILVERILRLNEKAKHYSEVSKRLAIVQEQLRMTKMEFESQINAQPLALQKRTVLFCDEFPKDSVLAKLAFGGTGVDVKLVSDINSMQESLKSNHFDMIFCETNLAAELLKNTQVNPERLVLLVRPRNEEYFQDIQKFVSIPNIISISPNNRIQAIKSIVSSVNKIFYNDFFGLEKYLMWGVDVKEEIILDSHHRHTAIVDMGQYFRQMGIRSSVIERVEAVAEEMLMNAIYDAPVDQNGKSLFNHIHRREKIELTENMRPKLRYACDGLTIALSVEDPFGALQRETIMKYLVDCTHGKINMKTDVKAGAGRGLYQIVMLSDDTIFNVEPKTKTEVISVFQLEIDKQNEKFPQINYFYK